jgi:hypothetical protein
MQAKVPKVSLAHGGALAGLCAPAAKCVASGGVRCAFAKFSTQSSATALLSLMPACSF